MRAMVFCACAALCCAARRLLPQNAHCWVKQWQLTSVWVADEIVKSSTKEAGGKGGSREASPLQDDAASVQESAEGSAFGSSFQGQPSQHEADADSLTSHLGPALGELISLECLPQISCSNFYRPSCLPTLTSPKASRKPCHPALGKYHIIYLVPTLGKPGQHS